MVGVDLQRLYQRPPYLLFIDQDGEEVNRVAGRFRKEGLAPQCLALQDGREALDFLFYRGKYRQHPRIKPSLILLKLQLPRITGFEVLRYIRDDDDLRKVPVIVLSDTENELDRREALKIGANAFICMDARMGSFDRSMKMILSVWRAASVIQAQRRTPVEV